MTYNSSLFSVFVQTDLADMIHRDHLPKLFCRSLVLLETTCSGLDNQTQNEDNRASWLQKVNIEKDKFSTI